MKSSKRKRTTSKEISHQFLSVRALKLHEPYQIINFIMAGLLGMMFVFFAFYQPEEDQFPIQSQYHLLNDGKTNSTGLSRAFSRIMSLQVIKAKQYNPYSLEVFSFFLVQFLLRITLFVVVLYNQVKNKLILLDVGMSVTLLLFCFKDLMRTMYV